MKITINSTKMLAALNQTVSGKVILLEFQEMEQLGKVMGIKTFNGSNIQVVAHVPISGAEKFEATTKYCGTTFFEVVKSIAICSDTVTITLLEELTISDASGSIQVKLPLLEKGTTLELPASEKPVAAFKANTKVFANALKQYGFAFTVKPAALYGCSVLLEESNLDLFSTEGHISIHGRIGVTPLMPSQKISVLFPPQVTGIINSFTEDETTVYIYEKFVLMNNGLTFLHFVKPTSEANTITTLLKVETEKEVTCNFSIKKSAIQHALQLIEKVETNDKISLSYNQKEIIVENVSGSVHFELPVEKIDGDISEPISLSSKMLSELLSKFIWHDEIIHFGYSSKATPLFILEEKACAFILPVV